MGSSPTFGTNVGAARAQWCRRGRGIRISDDLRAAYRSLAEVEGDQPGYDCDRYYLTGWYDVGRGIVRRLPRGLFREPARVAEFRLGYQQGRIDGRGRASDWRPDHAIGRIDADGHAIPGSGAGPLAEAIARATSAAWENGKTACPAAETPGVVSGAA